MMAPLCAYCQAAIDADDLTGHKQSSSDMSNALMAIVDFNKEWRDQGNLDGMIFGRGLGQEPQFASHRH